MDIKFVLRYYYVLYRNRRNQQRSTSTSMCIASIHNLKIKPCFLHVYNNSASKGPITSQSRESFPSLFVLTRLPVLRTICMTSTAVRFMFTEYFNLEFVLLGLFYSTAMSATSCDLFCSNLMLQWTIEKWSPICLEEELYYRVYWHCNEVPTCGRCRDCCWAEHQGIYWQQYRQVDCVKNVRFSYIFSWQIRLEHIYRSWYASPSWHISTH